MQTPNPVKPVSQQIQRFSRPQVQPQPPILSGGPGQQPSAEQPISAEAAIQQQMHELAMEIFARLAAEHISDDHYTTKPLSEEHLRQLASHSQRAARAYFEQMGVKFNGQS